MAIDSQVVPVDLGQGLDLKDDPKQVIAGKMLAMNNCSFKSPKELSKRDGFASIPQAILGGGSVSNGVGISSFQNELVSLDGSSLYSYSPDLAEQVNRGPLVPVSLGVSPVIRNTNQQTIQDSAFHAGTGLQCFTWLDTGASVSVNYSIFDSTTGAIIVSDAVVSATGTRAKVLTLGQYFIIIFFDSSDNHLRYRAINTSTPTAIGAVTDIATDISSAVPAFDATIINGSAYIAYRSGTSKVGFYSISSGLVLSSQFLENTTGAIHSAISIVGDASFNVWCAYTTGTTGQVLYGTVVNAALNSAILAPTSVATSINATGFDTFNITQIVNGTTATIYWEQTLTVSDYIRQNTLTITGTVGTAANVILRMGLASKAFVFGGVTYFLGIYAGDILANPVSTLVPTSIEPTYFLINASGKVIAKIAPSSAGKFYVSGLLPEVIPLSATKFSIPYQFEDDLSVVGGAIFYNTGVMNATLNFQIPYACPKITIGQNLHFGSGQLWAYDGASIVEQGFHIYPENLLQGITLGGGGIGSTLNSGAINQVQYKAIYEWADNQGQIHQSNPSPALTVPLPPTSILTAITFTANSTINSNVLTSVSSFSNLFVGQVLNDATNATNLNAGTYITQLDATNGNIYLSSPAVGSKSGDTYSTKDVVIIRIHVPALTATLKQNVSLVLYRTQNNQTIFYRVTSPSASTAGAANNGFTYNSLSSESITIVDCLPDSAIIGNEQLYTTGGVLGNINAPAISAVASYQQRMVYLSPENPFQLGYSQQVNDTDPVAFNSLELVQNLDQKIGRATAIGAMDTELIIFGPKRKFLLTGAGPAPNGTQNDFSTPTPIAGVSGCSNPVSVLELPGGLIYQDSQKGFWLLDRSLQEKYIGADVEQYNSQTVTSANLIPNATKCTFTLSNGVNLTYDYFVGQWETDPFPAAVIDSTNFQNDMTYIQANGLILQQTPGVFTDGGALIPMSLKTGWLSFAQISGFQRVWELQILETFKSPHALTVNIYTDYGTTPTTTKFINVPANVYTPFRIRLNVQKCTAVQVEIIESQPGGVYGEGLSLSSLAFKVGAKKGPYKLPAGQSY
jgi:hypothetical protein